MKKLIYIRYLPLTKKIRDDYYLNVIGSIGYSVEYWDITQLYFKNESILEHYEILEKDFFKVVRFNSFADVYSAIHTNRDALYILIMTFEWDILPILRILTKYNCLVSCFAFQMLPWYGGDISILKKIVYKFRQGQLIKSIMNKFLLPVAIKVGYIKMFDYMFTCGNYGWKGAGWVKESYLKYTKKLYLNNFDYDNYVNSEDNYDSMGNIVFIDQYYPFHPDTLLLTKNFKISSDNYFSQMNKLFDIIEDKYKKEVIIAAHPKALKYKEKNFFKGRKVIFDSTLSAIKHASLILAHESTAIGYAAMCHKPIIFINSKEISKICFNVKHFSEFFHQPIIDADNIDVKQLPNELVLSKDAEDAYQSIKYNYMTTFEKDVKNKDLIIKYVRNILGG